MFKKNNFLNNEELKISKNKNNFLADFYDKKPRSVSRFFLNHLYTIKRKINSSSLTISFLGPDGAGKSTVINELLANKLSFQSKEYFHLKPVKSASPNASGDGMVIDPHKYPPYSKPKSYIKLFYFIYQYNSGWLSNIIPLKIKSSLIIFDRYFDDILVDKRRYRYGGSIATAKFVRLFIPKPDLYFILTADANVIYARKQEVSFEELGRQIEAYRALADDKQYFNIDVNRSHEDITREVITIMMEKMNERF